MPKNRGAVLQKQFLRVCTYNIHKGYRYPSKSILTDIRIALRELNSDLLFLQEIRGKDNNTLDTVNNQFEYLADSVWPYYAYGRNAIYQHTHHGNAILSKFPFEESRKIDISKGFFSKRGIIMGKIRENFYVVCVHLGLMASERKYQINVLARMLTNFVPGDAPLIIAGDFNDFYGTLDKILTHQLGLTDVSKRFGSKLFKTFPSNMPVFCLDRIYFRNLHCIEAATMKSKPWNKLSDHCALTATFEI